MHTRSALFLLAGLIERLLREAIRLVSRTLAFQLGLTMELVLIPTAILAMCWLVIGDLEPQFRFGSVPSMIMPSRFTRVPILVSIRLTFAST